MVELPAFPPLPVPRDLYEYGLIGNMHTAALISKWGAVDWACMPRFASPSVFGRILDKEKGGTHAIRPLEGGTSQQRYRPSTNILETHFAIPGERELVLTDFMPVLNGRNGERSPMIVRMVSAHGGPVRIGLTFQPRFNYGAEPAVFFPGDKDLLASSGASEIRHRSPVEDFTITGDRAEAVALVSPGEDFVVELVWGEERPSDRSASALLSQTEKYWRTWIGKVQVPATGVPLETHPIVERSLLTLKLLSHRSTGAFVAAPTTSLPEWPGGVRNWDYRYSWIRDAAHTAKALVMQGHTDEAKAFLRWSLNRTHGRKNGMLRVLYGVHGETNLAERELPNLAGFLDSRPVRVGNGAEYQFQLDIYGSLLNLVHIMANFDAGFLQAEWPYLRALADEVVRLWRRPDRGIWEVRGPPANYVHSKLMAWVALDRSAKLARRFGTAEEVARWEREATTVREEILTRGFDPTLNSFVQSFERHLPDAATLRIPLMGFLPFDDPRVLGTIDRVVRDLSVGPFVYRYRASDGIGCPEGAFLFCSFWLVECLAGAGRMEEARRNWNELIQSASPLGLFSEEYDPFRKAPLGNYPQAFTHIGVLRAAMGLKLISSLRY